MECLDGQSTVRLQLLSSREQAIQTKTSSKGLDSLTLQNQIQRHIDKQERQIDGD